MRRRIVPGLIVATVLAAAGAAVGQQAQQCPMGREYFLYTPRQVDPNKTYWLVAGIHGFGGNGKNAGGYHKWATQRDDVIVVGPTLPTPLYTHAEDGSAQQLIGIHRQLSEKYKLHDRMFVAGFSGGSQFAHRFAMLHPDKVIGFAAHSGGSWATGGPWKSINPKAATIPFVMSCGEADTKKMHPDAPMGRLEWAKAFEKLAREKGMTFKAAYFPGVGHKASPETWKMSTECFELATGAASAKGADPKLTMIRRQAERGSVANALRLADQYRKAQGDAGEPKLPAGWSMGDDAKAGWADRRAASIESAITDALSPAVARGLKMVTTVVQRNAPNRNEQLARLRKMYAGLKEVEQAIDEALDGSNPQ